MNKIMQNSTSNKEIHTCRMRIKTFLVKAKRMNHALPILIFIRMYREKRIIELRRFVRPYDQAYLCSLSLFQQFQFF